MNRSPSFLNKNNLRQEEFLACAKNCEATNDDCLTKAENRYVDEGFPNSKYMALQSNCAAQKRRCRNRCKRENPE